MKANYSRREFISVSLAGSALLISTSWGHAENSPENSKSNPKSQLSPLIKIHSDNQITFFYPSPEMGQGVDTSLAMLFIDELGGDFDLVKVEPMPYQIRRDPAGKVEPVAVPQFSGGSTSISRNYALLRNAGASARQLLLQAA
jgi:isoquinoline 1-oxidoreductase beta subunit